jgi:LysR family transcriptional regulator (chromosome initiation inhibitor)
MFAEQLVADEVAAGSLKRVSDAHLDVPLFWQCWKLDSPMVDAITSAVRAAASSLREVRT